MTEKLTVPEVLLLVRRLYDGEDECTRHSGIVGGHLHIVLDDGNVKTSHVDWCIEEAEKDNCVTCLSLARKLRTMSLTQRGKIYRRRWR